MVCTIQGCSNYLLRELCWIFKYDHSSDTCCVFSYKCLWELSQIIACFGYHDTHFFKSNWNPSIATGFVFYFVRYTTTLHYTTLHYTTPHHITPHHTTAHHTTLHPNTPHYTHVHIFRNDWNHFVYHLISCDLSPLHLLYTVIVKNEYTFIPFHQKVIGFSCIFSVY